MPRPTIYLMGPQHEYLLCGPTCYRMVVLTSWDRSTRVGVETGHKAAV